VRIRNTPEFHDLPFLMVTSKDSTEDAVLALRSGANDFIRKPYHPEELLARVKNLVTGRLLQKQLERQASHDELTGLLNYRSCRSILQTEIDRVKRYGGELALILFDIDHFKKFNDDFGHPTGNLMLENLGVLVQGNIRAVDYPCRSGGGEFTVILPCTDLKGAVVVARRLNRKIAEYHFGVHKNRKLTLTCSFGAAELKPKTDTLESFLKKTKDSMQQSKKSGTGGIAGAEGC
jgi:two-component system cell cycle response regulator